MEKSKGSARIISLRQEEELLVLIRAYCREHGFMHRGEPNVNQFFRVVSTNALLRDGKIDWRAARRLSGNVKKKK